MSSRRHASSRCVVLVFISIRRRLGRRSLLRWRWNVLRQRHVHTIEVPILFVRLLSLVARGLLNWMRLRAMRRRSGVSYVTFIRLCTIFVACCFRRNATHNRFTFRSVARTLCTLIRKKAYFSGCKLWSTKPSLLLNANGLRSR